MELFLLLNLLFLVISVVLNLFLAVYVYGNNPTSATNKLYAFLSLIISFWLIANYFSLHPDFFNSNLFFIRLSIFFAAPLSAGFFLLANTLPSLKLLISKKVFLFIIFITAVIMIINISPYAFIRLEIVNNSPQPIAGLWLMPFALLSTYFSFAAVYFLIKKWLKTVGPEKDQFKLVGIGVLLMLGLVIFTVFMPAVLFNLNIFVSFIPIYTLIFLGLTAYAIVRHHLFNLKIIATQVLVGIIAIVLLAKLLFFTSLNDFIIDLLIFISVQIFGFFLIKSVKLEVQQREKLQELTEKLEMANKQLIDLSRFKTELLSLASHQVKSPLAVIKGYASILLDGLYGKMNGKIKDTVFKMKESTDGLIVLVNNLLDLRKIEEGRMEYQFQPLKLKELVIGVVSELKSLAEIKNLELTFEARSDKSVNADAVKLKQVVQNLIDNAIKYTPQGFVRVELNEDGDNLVLSVKDSGLGMSKELLSLVFQEFVRDERVKKEIRGTGLGLYIAKKIVEAHGGEIWAESEGEGKGSEFFAKLKIIG